MTDPARQHVALTRTIERWLQVVNVGGSVTPAECAVDLADILHAAADVRLLLSDLLATDPNTSSQAEQALQLAANIDVQLFTELKGHLETLEVVWPQVLERLEELGR